MEGFEKKQPTNYIMWRALSEISCNNVCRAVNEITYNNMWRDVNDISLQ